MKLFKGKKRSGLIALAVLAFTAAPVLAAVIVQNFVQSNVTVAEAPIVKEAGADDATTDFLTINTTATVVNNDDNDGVGADTAITNEQVDFTCFTGDRTYYTDALRLRNTTTEDWDVTLRVENDIAGNPSVSGGAFGDNADIWLYVNNADAPVANIAVPNPTSGALDAAWNGDYIQIESDGTVMSVTDGVIAPFTIPAGEERQVALVVDCGAAATTGTTGTFRFTVEATPAP